MYIYLSGGFGYIANKQFGLRQVLGFLSFGIRQVNLQKKKTQKKRGVHTPKRSMAQQSLACAGELEIKNKE